ncbi:O-antigen ligase family protein [Devosia sp. CAU 1758]
MNSSLTEQKRGEPSKSSIGPASKSGYLLTFFIGLIPLIASLHYAGLVDYHVRTETTANTELVGSAFALWLGLSIAYIIQTKIRIRLNYHQIAVVAFFLYCLFTSIASVSPINSAVASIFYMSVVIVTSIMWPVLIKYRIAFWHAAIVHTVFILFLIFELGVRPSGTVGGIQPNQFAKLGIIVLVLTYLSGTNLKWIGVSISILTCTIATSRGGILYMSTFLLVYYANRINLRWLSVGAVGLMIMLPLLLFVESVARIPTVGLIYSEILLLDDPRFNFESGFTGRSDRWAVGMDLIGEAPFIGNGFSTRTTVESFDPRTINSHQGHLNLILDVGFFGYSLFCLSAIAALNNLLRRWVNSSIMRTSGAAVFSYLVLMLIDPTHFGPIFPLSILFVLCLTASAPVESESGHPQKPSRLSQA